MKFLFVSIILIMSVELIAQPYKLNVNWEFTSSYEIDIDNIEYVDKYGRVEYEDKDFDPNSQMDLSRECRKISLVIPDALEALESLDESLSNECNELIVSVKTSILQGQLKIAIDQIVNKMGVECLSNELILIASQYNRIQQSFSCGIISYSNFSIEANRVTLAFLGSLDEVVEYNCGCN